MDPRSITRAMVIKRLLESLPEEKREKNKPAIEKTADRIMGDLDQVIKLLVVSEVGDGTGLAPKQCQIKGLAA